MDIIEYNIRWKGETKCLQFDYDNLNYAENYVAKYFGTRNIISRIKRQQ
jgi:hypothetical protein